MIEQENATSPFSVLFVCTGNICRSPVAEQLFRAKTRGISALLHVASEGTGALAGQVMTEQAKELSLKYGGDPLEHRASLLSAEDVRRADLILTATRSHRAEVVSLVPRANRTAFTLREFSRLVAIYRELEPDAFASTTATDSEGLSGFVRAVASKRGFSQSLPSPSDDDIVDPYRREQAVYDEAGRVIDDATESIAWAFNYITDRQNPIFRDEASQKGSLDNGPRSFRSAAMGE